MNFREAESIYHDICNTNGVAEVRMWVEPRRDCSGMPANYSFEERRPHTDAGIGTESTDCFVEKW